MIITMWNSIAGLLVMLLVAPSTAGAWGFETHKFIVSRFMHQMQTTRMSG